MSDGVDVLTAREPSLVRLYMDLPGASESVARSVFMHVCGREADQDMPDETRNDMLAFCSGKPDERFVIEQSMAGFWQNAES